MVLYEYAGKIASSEFDLSSAALQNRTGVSLDDKSRAAEG
jgi:hypothetical protein